MPATLPEEIRDQIEDKAVRQPLPDPISEAVGDPAYVHRQQFDDCRRVYPEIGAYGQKMVFTRFYFNAGLLVDVFDERQPPDGEIDFKRDWCAGHGYRYAVTDGQDLDPIRAALTDQPEEAEAEEPKKRAKTQRPRKPARGKVQRPRSRTR